MAAAKLRVKYVKFLIAALLFFLTFPILFAEQYEDSFVNMESTVAVDAVRRYLPVYLSELFNINDYILFANGGWDVTPQLPQGVE